MELHREAQTLRLSVLASSALTSPQTDLAQDEELCSPNLMTDNYHNFVYVLCGHVTVVWFTDLSKVCAVHLQQCMVSALSRNGNGLIGFLGLRGCKHATFDAPASEHLEDVMKPHAL